jgi:hypothetical protein
VPNVVSGRPASLASTPGSDRPWGLPPALYHVSAKAARNGRSAIAW